MQSTTFYIFRLVHCLWFSRLPRRNNRNKAHLSSQPQPAQQVQQPLTQRQLQQLQHTQTLQLHQIQAQQQSHPESAITWRLELFKAEGLRSPSACHACQRCSEIDIDSVYVGCVDSEQSGPSASAVNSLQLGPIKNSLSNPAPIGGRGRREQKDC